jgi:hypothetical protein
MTKLGIHAAEISAEDAKLFWNSCGVASVFCDPEIISALGVLTRYFAAFKGEAILCVWPVPIDNLNSSRPIDFAYYFGPYFKENSYREAPYRAFATNLRAINALLDLVISEVKSINFCLLPDFTDVRPFLWWNYHNEGAPKFRIDIKYTAVIRNLRSLGDEELKSMFRPDDKRKKIRRYLSNKPTDLVENFEVQGDDVTSLYELTIKRSGGEISGEELASLKKFVELVKGEHRPARGWLISLASVSNSNLVGFQLLLASKNTIYAVAQCVSEEYRTRDLNVYLTYRSIILARDHGFDCFDFNGANSPNRADDKHAFGARAVPYYELTLD